MSAEDVAPHVCDSADPDGCTRLGHDRCPNCGKALDEHPTVKAGRDGLVYLCQERAVKWQRVEPGHVIRAGQPYRVEFSNPNLRADLQAAREYAGADRDWTYHELPSEHLYVDSSWKPPLALPASPEAALREVVAWLEDKPEIPGRLGRSKVMRAVDETCDYIASELRRRADEIEAAR